MNHEIKTYKTKLISTETTIGKLETVFGREKLDESVKEIKEEELNTFRSEVQDYVLGKQLETLAEERSDGTKTFAIKKKVEKLYKFKFNQNSRNSLGKGNIRQIA